MVVAESFPQTLPLSTNKSHKTFVQNFGIKISELQFHQGTPLGAQGQSGGLLCFSLQFSCRSRRPCASLICHTRLNKEGPSETSQGLADDWWNAPHPVCPVIGAKLAWLSPCLAWLSPCSCPRPTETSPPPGKSGCMWARTFEQKTLLEISSHLYNKKIQNRNVHFFSFLCFYYSKISV